MDISLKRYRRICKSKGYNKVLKVTVIGLESSLLLVAYTDTETVVYITKIEFRKDFST